MPVITLEAAKLTKEQKSRLVKEFTSKASEIMNTPERAFIVLLKENEMTTLEKVADELGFHQFVTGKRKWNNDDVRKAWLLK